MPFSQNLTALNHDALWDARNTAKIFALSKNESEFQRIMGPVIEAFKPVTPMTSTLGDLFPVWPNCWRILNMLDKLAR